MPNEMRKLKPGLSTSFKSGDKTRAPSDVFTSRPARGPQTIAASIFPDLRSSNIVVRGESKR